MMEHEEQAYFFDLVKQMRSAQKEYFRTRSQYWLRRSKVLEKSVDNMIQNVEKPSDNQQKLDL